MPTIVDLKALCKANNIKGYSAINKNNKAEWERKCGDVDNKKQTNKKPTNKKPTNKKTLTNENVAYQFIPIYARRMTQIMDIIKTSGIDSSIIKQFNTIHDDLRRVALESCSYDRLWTLCKDNDQEFTRLDIKETIIDIFEHTERQKEMMDVIKTSGADPSIVIQFDNMYATQRYVHPNPVKGRIIPILISRVQRIVDIIKRLGADPNIIEQFEAIKHTMEHAPRPTSIFTYTDVLGVLCMANEQEFERLGIDERISDIIREGEIIYRSRSEYHQAIREDQVIHGEN